MATALFDKYIGKTLAITLIYSLALGLFIYAFQPFSVKALELSVQQISLVFAVFGLTSLITQVVIIPPVTRRFGEKRTLVVSLLLTTLTFAAFAFSSSLTMMIVICVAQSLVSGFINPLVQALLSKEVDAQSQGTVQGLNASYMSVGTILGPIVGGLVATIYLPGPFLVGAGVVFICFLISLRIYKQHLAQEHLFAAR